MRRMFNWKSLQARLLLGAALWVAVGLALSGAAVSSLFRGHVTDQFTHEIDDHLTEIFDAQLREIRSMDRDRIDSWKSTMSRIAGIGILATFDVSTGTVNSRNM